MHLLEEKGSVIRSLGEDARETPDVGRPHGHARVVTILYSSVSLFTLSFKLLFHVFVVSFSHCVHLRKDISPLYLSLEMFPCIV